MRRGAAWVLLCAVAMGFVASVAPGGQLVAIARASSAVAVFPIAGTRYNLPATQITFRGINPAQIGSVRVSGSRTGSHLGRLLPDSDGNGASFMPSRPFAPGETVTVTTQLNVIGGAHGTFHFAIAKWDGLIGYGRLPLAAATPGSVQSFRSRPDLQPAALRVISNHAPSSEGDIFLAPQFGPTQDGPMILDPQGNVVWFKPYPVMANVLVTDFRVQSLFGQPVLTWWQGNTNTGHGRGVGVIFDRNYQQIGTVRAGNGLDMGLHEFRITGQGDAYINASSQVSLPGISKPTIDSVVQEIDIRTGLVLFEWHALDHVPISDSYFQPGPGSGHIYDPYHVNSVSLDVDGNVIVSMRNTGAVYKIDHQTGKIIWQLGGKRSSFKLGPGTATWGQHDAEVQADGTITIFDDGAGPPTVHPYTRGLRESVDTRAMTATLIREFDHQPSLSSDFEGNTQLLSDGNVFLGWGQQPYFSEDTATGQQVFDARFVSATSTYRAYRFSWSAQPPTNPDLAVVPNSDGSMSLYASWNGATDVASWQALAGSSPSALAPVGTATKRGFETNVRVLSAAPYMAVQALDSGGHVLATSAAQATPPHIAVYGHSAFVPPASGMGGVPVSCFAAHPCRLVTTVWSGRTLLARTGREYVAAGGAAVVYFRLSAAGRSRLAQAANRRLPVRVSVQDTSGLSVAAPLNLVPFYTFGPSPPRSIRQSASVHIVGATAFVSSGWIGAVLAGCLSSVPCHVITTLSVGSTVIAHTAGAPMGAGELGYLFFTLTGAGHALLAHARGNQLPVTATLSDGSNAATGQLALVGFR